MMTTRSKYTEVSGATSDNPAATADAETALHEVIAERAYELYQLRDPGEGDALTDWLMAEAEIRAAIGAADTQQPEKATGRDQSTASRASR